MLKINKVLKTKIIPFIVAVVFSLNSTVYGIDISRNAQLKLRAPLITQSEPERLIKAQHDFTKEEKLLSPIGCLGRGIKATKKIYKDIRSNGLSCPLARGETSTSLYPEAVSLSLSVDGWFDAFAIEEFGPSKSVDNVVFILDPEWVKSHKENFKLIGTNFNPKSTSRSRYLKGLKLLNLDEHPWDITLRLVDFVPRLPIRDEIHFIAISQDQLDAIPPEAIYAIIAHPEKIEQILQWDKELGLDPLPIFAWKGGTYIRKLSLFNPNARKINAQLALKVSSEVIKRIAQIGDLETIRGIEDIFTFAEKLGAIEITGEEAASSLFAFEMGIQVLDKNGWDIIKEMREDAAIFRDLCEEDPYFEWLGKLAAYKEVNGPGIYFNHIAMQHREEKTGRKVTKSYFILQLYELLASELDLTDIDFYNTTYRRHPIVIEGCFRFASLMGPAELEAMHSLIKEFMYSVFLNREKILKNITRLIKYSKTQEFHEEALRMFFSEYALNSSAEGRQRLQAAISSPATHRAAEIQGCLEDIWKEFSKRFTRVISPRTGRPLPGTSACEKISLIAAKILAKLGAKDIIIVYQEKGMEYHAWVECIWNSSLYIIDASAGMLESNPVHGKIIKVVPLAYEEMNAIDRSIYLGEEGGVFLYFFVTGEEKDIKFNRPHRIVPIFERLLDLTDRYKLGDLKNTRAEQAAILEASERVKKLIVTELRGKELDAWHVALQLRISIDAADRALDELVKDKQLYMTKGKYYWVISGGSGLSRTNLPAGIDLEKVNADELERLKRWEFGQAISAWYKAEIPFLTLISYGDYMLRSSISGYRDESKSKRYALLQTEPPRIIVTYDGSTMEFTVLDGMNRLGAAYIKGDMNAPMKAYIGIIKQDLGSPSSVFKLLSTGKLFDGKPHTRRDIANALNRSERTIQPDLYFLVKAGLLKRLDVATYQINQELLENPDLISSIQAILDEEFKYGEIVKNLRNKEERRRIADAISKIMHDAIGISEEKYTKIDFKNFSISRLINDNPPLSLVMYYYATRQNSTVNAYSKLSTSAPPIDVIYDVGHDKYVVMDGYKRIGAAVLRGENEINAIIYEKQDHARKVEVLSGGFPVPELGGLYMLEVKVDGVEYEISPEDLKRIKGMNPTIVTNPKERKKIAEVVDGTHPELHLGETALREGWHWWPPKSNKKAARTAL